MRRRFRPAAFAVGSAFALALLVGTGEATAQLPGSTDTLSVADSTQWARDRFDRALRDYYMNARVRYGGETTGDRTSCNGDMRQVCFGGDIDALVCPHGITECIPDDPEGDRELLVEELLAGLAVLDDDPFVVGQVAYSLSKFGRHDEAIDIADGCVADGWWCTMLAAYTRAEAGRTDEALSTFEAMFEAMPAAERCDWRDIMPLLPAEMRRDYLATPCAEREALEERVWFLADPSWLIEGNERRLGHWVRKAHIRLHEDLWSLARSLVVVTGDQSGGGFYDQRSDAREYAAFDGHNAHHALDESFAGGHKGVVAIGFQDSWFHNGLVDASENREGHWRQWVSRTASRYRFVPDASALEDPMSSEEVDWFLTDREAWERFSPRRTFAELDHQMVWFRERAQGELVISGEVDRDPRFGDGERWAGWVLHASPDPSDVRTNVSRQSRDQYTFSEVLEPKPYLMGMEVIGVDHQARTRYSTRPPWVDDGITSVSTSDLLLYRPVGDAAPADRDEAVAIMRGGRRWEADASVGVYWEYYGLRPGVEAEVSVSMIPIVGGERQEGSEPMVRWTDQAPQALPVWSRTVVLDLSLVSPGAYFLRYTIEVPGQRPLVREAPVILEAPSAGRRIGGREVRGR